MTIDVKELPYFMTNSEWTTIDENTGDLILTNKAPREAIESYNEYIQTYREAEAESVEIVSNKNSDIAEEDKAMKMFGL